MAILPFTVLVVRNNTFYYSVQTEKPATFRIWKNVTMNSQMPNIFIYCANSTMEVDLYKSLSKPTN